MHVTKGGNRLATNKYTTISGDEWDGICFKHYGENGEMLLDKVMFANPFHMNTVVFSAGIVLNMPAFNLEEKQSVDDLPPWMR